MATNFGKLYLIPKIKKKTWMSQGDLSYLITALQQREVFCIFRSLLKKKVMQKDGYSGLKHKYTTWSGLECAKGSFRKKVKETIPMEKHWK